MLVEPEGSARPERLAATCGLDFPALRGEELEKLSKLFSSHHGITYRNGRATCGGFRPYLCDAL